MDRGNTKHGPAHDQEIALGINSPETRNTDNP